MPKSLTNPVLTAAQAEELLGSLARVVEHDPIDQVPVKFSPAPVCENTF